MRLFVGYCIECHVKQNRQSLQAPNSKDLGAVTGTFFEVAARAPKNKS